MMHAWFTEWWELGCLVFSPGMGSSDNWRYSWGWEPTWKPGHFSHPPENRPTLICHLYHSFFLMMNVFFNQEMVERTRNGFPDLQGEKIGGSSHSFSSGFWSQCLQTLAPSHLQFPPSVSGTWNCGRASQDLYFSHIPKNFFVYIIR